MNKINAMLSVATAVVLVLILATVLPLASARSVPAALADGSGIIRSRQVELLATGATGYSVTSPISPLYTTAGYVGDFGAIQLQIRSEVTGSQVVTWTPQFSNQPLSGNCNNTTQWFDATSYTSYATATYYAPIVYWWEQMIFSAKTQGPQQVGLEMQTVGQCVRLRYEIDTAETLITPTVYLRPLNRQ